MKRILDELRSEMDRIVFSLVENPAKDFTSYLERVGKYNGLAEAVQIVTHAEEEDDIKRTF